MKIIVTGANGFLGQHICHYFQQVANVYALGKGAKRLPFTELEYHDADVNDNNRLLRLFHDIQPDVIIHTAAVSKPDEGYHHPEKCETVNVDGTRSVIDAARALQVHPHLVFTSSDFVLGEGGPHDETAVPAPLNYYGEGKLRAEKLVMESGLPATIIRPVFMYGPIWTGMRPTFLHWIWNALNNHQALKVVDDQYRTPAYAGDVCHAINAIILRKATGLFHLGGADRVTPYQMAVTFAEMAGLDADGITPVTGAEFKEPVQRAKQGGVMIDKARQQLGYVPHSLAEGIRKVVDSLIK